MVDSIVWGIFYDYGQVCFTNKEINVAEFARSLGMNATLQRNYINGFKKPSAEREKAIIDHIHKLGREMIAVCF